MRALNQQGVALSRAKVLVLGLAYKRNAGDARESPAVALIHRLLADGAEVAVADPHVVERMPTDALTRRVALTAAGARAGRRGRAGDRPRRLRLRPGDRARSPGAGHPAPAGRSRCRAPLAGRSIAVILSGWPRVSESFALNELLALHRAGMLAAVLATEDRRRRDPAPGRGAARRRWSRSSRRRTSAAQAEAAVSRLDGIGVSAVHGYFAHAPGRGRRGGRRQASASRTGSACTRWTRARCPSRSSATGPGGPPSS